MRIPNTVVVDMARLKQEVATASSGGLDAPSSAQRLLDGLAASGRKIESTVVSVKPDGVTLLIDGKQIKLSADQLNGLEVGTKVLLEVLKSSKDQLALRLGSIVPPLAPGAAPAQTPSEAAFVDQLKNQLKAMGLAVNDKSIQILKAQREFGLPLVRDVFLNLQSAQYHLKESAALLQNQGGSPMMQGDQRGHGTLDWTLAPKAFFEQLTTTLTTLTGPTPQTSQTPQTGHPVQPIVGQGGGSLPVPQPISWEGQVAQDLAVGTLEKQAPQVTNLARESFFDRLSSALVKMADEGDALTATLAFMEKQNMPKGTLDVLLTHQLMKGTLDVSGGIFELIDDLMSFEKLGNSIPKSMVEQLESALSEAKKGLLHWDRVHEGLEGDQVKSQIAQLEKLSESLSQLKITSETGERALQLDAVNKAVTLVADSQNWSMLTMPMQIAQKITDVEIYVKRDGKHNKPLDPDNSLIYIALNTEHLEAIKVKILAQKEAIHITIMTESEGVKHFLEDFASELHQAVQGLVTKPVRIGFENPVDMPNLATLERLDLSHTHLFDMKV